MQPTPSSLKRIFLTAAFVIAPLALMGAEEPPLRELLRDGLYAEEVSRDPEAAARQYEQVLSRFGEQRNFAAAALFRLAEVRRKQDRKEDAVKLYQQLLAEFPGAANEIKLARQNLAALGGKVPETPGEVTDDETRELARLEGLKKSAPDVLLAPEAMNKAAENGWLKVTKLLIDAGSDPLAGKALTTAAGRGYLDVVKLLTAGKEAVSENLAEEVIAASIVSDRPMVLEYLLQTGFKPGYVTQGVYKAPALALALVTHKNRLAEILVKHGADPNELSKIFSGRTSGGGTALHLVSENGDLAAVEWLLAHGGDPKRVDPIYGVSPLHVAALSRSEQAPAIMKVLLKAGADPDATAGAPDDPKENNGSEANSDFKSIAERYRSVLTTAVAPGSQVKEKLELLLARGADPNLRYGKLTLSKGQGLGDPFYLGTEPEISTTLSPLYGAAAEGSTAGVKLLLEHGAVPGIPELSTIISWVARADEDGSVVRKLVSFHQGDLNFRDIPSMREWKPAAREAFLDGAVYPALAKRQGIHLFEVATGRFNTMKEGSQGASPPDLAALLLAQPDLINPSSLGPHNRNEVALTLTLARRDSEGRTSRVALDLEDSAPFPGLQWNDVIEANLTLLKRDSRRIQNPTPDLAWALRKRMAFPVTVEIGGKVREIKLSGNRVIFDPTKDEAPMTDVQGLVELLWPAPPYASNQAATILVNRRDWPEVRLAYGSNEARKFPLESGDRVKLEITDSSVKALGGFRSGAVVLKAVDHPFLRTFGEGSNVPLSAITIPTLVQALVDAQTPASSSWKYWKGRKALTAEDLQDAGETYRNFAILPHPDLAHIRILRLQEDGEETVIEVDLAKAIAAVTAQTTREEIRQADVSLQAGDIVEIPLKKETLSEPWRGFTADESRFFAQAISGKVQMTGNDGQVRFSEIDYRAPQFIETEIGWVPVPAETGVPSARGVWLDTVDNGGISRVGESDPANPQFAFLRDGDVFRGTGGKIVSPPMRSNPQPGQQPGQREQPRPRVVPPPSSSPR